MEEQRTRRALDELADLFLTGPAGGMPHASDDAADATPSNTTLDEESNALPPSSDQPASDAIDAAKPHPESPKGVDATADEPETEDDAAFDALKGFDLDGPAPIRLPPKTRPASANNANTHGGGRRRASQSASYESGNDAMPAQPYAPWSSSPPSSASPSHLRLHRADDTGNGLSEASSASSTDERTTPRDQPATASVEAVLLGNLPGLSGPWLTQYAQRVAQREGPVLLLHIDEEGVDVELVEPTDRPQTPGRVPPRGQASDLVDRLETLVRLAPNPVRRVLVHVEADAQPMVLARLRSLDIWTLITGADDAAVVAGYRLIKRMIETDPAATPQRIGIMMMGSDDDTACRGIARLRNAAGSFLDSPLELVGAQRQMVPVNLRQLGRFEPIQTLWPPLRRWLAKLEPAETQAASAAEETPAQAHPESARSQPRQPAERSSMQGEMVNDLETVFNTLGQSEPDTPAAPVEVAPDDTILPDAPAASPAKAASSCHAGGPVDDADAAATGTVTDTPDLATFLTRDSLAGGVVLEARCPHQPATQLLLDQNGRLHLLRRHEPAANGSPAPQHVDDLPTLRRAVVELLEARTWVNEHVDLLALTQRQCQFDRAAEPVLHLFTHRADLATALVARLGTTLKLHLLQHVGQGAQATWFSTPLS